MKIHLLLDNEGYPPCFAHITDGKSHDITVGRTLRFAPGTIVAMDKGYVDYRWWKQITEDGAYFVSRLKEDLHYEVLEEESSRRTVRCCGTVGSVSPRLRSGPSSWHCGW